jgi:heavy metal translocating P-type ATPase
VVNQVEKCDLCGQEVRGEPVERAIDGEKRHFCCEGCARVYEVAHDNEMLDHVLPQPQTKRQGLTDFFLDRGESAHFTMDGMWCAGCAQAAEQVLRKQPGVKDVQINFAAERGRIQYNPEQLDPEAVLRGLDSLGYRARLVTDPQGQRMERQQESLLLQLIAAAAFGMQVMLLYLVQLYQRYAAGDFNAPDVRKLQYLVWALATPALFYGGSSILRGAWRALRARTATMDTLVALGTLSAYSYSVYAALTGSGEVYFDSVVMITTFIMMGRYLEKLGGAQARKGIRKLLRLQPTKAWRRGDNGWLEVDPNTLQPGDTILIKPGQRVPVDAEVVAGEATLNEALLTGESEPVDKAPGDAVFAGTVVTDDPLTCRVVRPVQETRLAQITQMVDQTLSSKPPIQRLADKASAYFAFGILGASLLTAVGWWLTGHAASQALLTAVAVLVVACPCALGLATPLALAVTLGRTTEAGILVRNAVALETAATIQRMVFDKTGTLTRGRMSVVGAVADAESELADEDLLCMAAAVEQFSEHPIAKAVLEACPGSPPKAQEFRNLRGLGASANVQEPNERRVMVGSSSFLEVDGRSPLSGRVESHAARGETVIWVGWADAIAGYIALRDEPNPSAREALAQLQAEGIAPVILSGDSQRTTQAIADELGVAHYEGNCPPTQKASRIQSWQSKGERVGMVGDGVNDAPALAQADLSITVAGGTDVAGETSDVVLTHSDLVLVPWFMQLSRRTRRIIHQNLGWAFAYNLVAVPLASLGVISPVIAAATMATSSLLVVGNSLRLRHA